MPSPNHRLRRGAEELRFVIIHGTWMHGDDAALARLCDPAAEVSCHYYITREGEIIQMVGEDMVAYHAGKSRWVLPGGSEIDGLNGWSLGIEVANAGPFNVPPQAGNEAAAAPADWARAEPYTEKQYVALVELLRDILVRNPAIIPACVLGHADVSPKRKSDPGPHFDWERLEMAGVCARPV